MKNFLLKSLILLIFQTSQQQFKIAYGIRNVFLGIFGNTTRSGFNLNNFLSSKILCNILILLF